MKIVAAIGSTALGIVIGWLVRYFIRRFENFTAAALGSVVSIIIGGAVVKFLGPDASTLWFYPIGLLLGFVIYQVIATKLMRPPPPGASPPPPPPDQHDPRFIIR